jgi:hypothetical protein
MLSNLVQCIYLIRLALSSRPQPLCAVRWQRRFRENELDETVLPNLTAEDLKDLGVSIVGHRRKLPRTNDVGR